MSDEVQLYYEALNTAASGLDTALSDLIMEAASLVGEDTGIENPAYRATLRLEMHRRLTALHDTSLNRTEAVGNLSAAIRDIATRYSELDTELTGQDQP